MHPLAQAAAAQPQSNPQAQAPQGFGPAMHGLKTPGASFTGAGAGQPQGPGGFNPAMLQQLLQQSKGGKPGMQAGPQNPQGHQSTFGQPAGQMQFPGGGWGQ